MNYRRIICTVFAIAAMAVSAGTLQADEEALKTVSELGITVSYPAHMESQANKILGIAKQSLLPSINIHQQTISLLSNADSISKDIASLLGADEKAGKIKDRLAAYKSNSQALVQCFSNIRIVKTGDAIGAGGVDAGVLQVRYDKSKNEFNMVIDQANINPDTLKRSYFPVFVNSDGSIRAESKITEMALDFLGSNKSMIIAPIQDTVGYTMVQELYIYYPLSRWFNEGVSGWITRFVVAKNNPKLSQMANDLYSVNSIAKQYRDKINFLAWPQSSYENIKSPNFDASLEAAQSRYAVELISNVLGRDGAVILPKIMSGINYNSNADNDTICSAITKATGKDFKPMLMEYVPDDVKTGMSSGESAKLVAQAELLVKDKKWNEATDKLQKAVEMDPDNANTRLNYAWVEREIDKGKNVDKRRDSEFQIFLAARLLKPGNSKFHMIAESLEGNYVLGRLAILIGDIQYAKKLLEPVLEVDPNHEDAKRAMADIKRLEDAAKKPAADAQ